jgi:hypothetical protein
MNVESSKADRRKEFYTNANFELETVYETS